MTSTQLAAAEAKGNPIAKFAAHFVFTSVDDMKSSLSHITDREHLAGLILARMVCETEGMKTKAKHLRSKIKQLERVKP